MRCSLVLHRSTISSGIIVDPRSSNLVAKKGIKKVQYRASRKCVPAQIFILSYITYPQHSQSQSSHSIACKIVSFYVYVFVTREHGNRQIASCVTLSPWDKIISIQLYWEVVINLAARDLLCVIQAT